MKPFANVAGNTPRRSVFDNSYYKVFDCDIGWLIPTMCDLYLPGDKVDISVEALIRANPMVTPIMHRVDLKWDMFAVPLRIMWPKPDYKDEEGLSLGYTKDSSSWEEFLTGGVKGKLKPVQPKWTPVKTQSHSLWDYFGNPLGVSISINAWQKRAYNMVYNEYYRAPDYEDPVDLDDEELHRAKWEKDYFTSAVNSQLRGTAPSVPFTGEAHAVWNNVREYNDSSIIAATGPIGMSTNPTGFIRPTTNTVGQKYFIEQGLNNNKVDLSNLGTFTIEDLRFIHSIQKNLELSMRAGSRLTEHILAHWNVHNGDSRLQRPEYIGGIRTPIIVSEVLQTSQTVKSGQSLNQTAQGNLAGHGIGSASNRAGSYYCKEHCVIIGIMRLMPKPVYQQGIQRQWLYETRFEYPTPELVNLGEQEIFNMELVATTNQTYNKGIFGYQGRYDEHRVKHNMVCGDLRSTSPIPNHYWHLARYFDPLHPPALNKEFLDVVDDKRAFAVTNLPGWIVTFGHRIRRVAPLPIMGIPN